MTLRVNRVFRTIINPIHRVVTVVKIAEQNSNSNHFRGGGINRSMNSKEKHFRVKSKRHSPSRKKHGPYDRTGTFESKQDPFLWTAQKTKSKLFFLWGATRQIEALYAFKLMTKWSPQRKLSKMASYSSSWHLTEKSIFLTCWFTSSLPLLGGIITNY